MNSNADQQSATPPNSVTITAQQLECLVRLFERYRYMLQYILWNFSNSALRLFIDAAIFLDNEFCELSRYTLLSTVPELERLVRQINSGGVQGSYVSIDRQEYIRLFGTELINMMMNIATNSNNPFATRARLLAGTGELAAAAAAAERAPSNVPSAVAVPPLSLRMLADGQSPSRPLFAWPNQSRSSNVAPLPRLSQPQPSRSSGGGGTLALGRLASSRRAASRLQCWQRCFICDTPFTSRHRFSLHLVQAHSRGDEDGRLACTVCRISYSYKNNCTFYQHFRKVHFNQYRKAEEMRVLATEE